METNKSLESHPNFIIKHIISDTLVDIVISTNNIDTTKAKNLLYFILRNYEYKYMTLKIINVLDKHIYLCFNCSKPAQQDDVDYVVDYIHTTLVYNLDTII